MRKCVNLLGIQVNVPSPWSLLVLILVNAGQEEMIIALALLLEAWLESWPQTQWQDDIKQITQFPRLGFSFCKTGNEWHHWELLWKSRGMAPKPCSAQRQCAGLGLIVGLFVILLEWRFGRQKQSFIYIPKVFRTGPWPAAGRGLWGSERYPAS